MIALEFETPDDLFRGMSLKFLNEDPTVDQVLKFTAISYGVLLQIRQPQVTDLGKAGYTPIRWTTFCNTYLQAEPFRDWLKRIREADDRSQVEMQIQPSSGRHRYGACLSSISFSRLDGRVTLISRAVQLFPMGVLDLNLAAILAEYFHRVYDIPVGIRWFVQQLQFRADFSIPWLLQAGVLDELTDTSMAKRAAYALKLGDRVAGGESFPFRRYQALGEKIQQMKTEGFPPFVPQEIKVNGELLMKLLDRREP